MKTVCSEEKCTACGACAQRCSQKAISIIDNIRTNVAVIDENKCINCNACYTVCQNKQNICFEEPIEILQGWVDNSHSRMNSSSGGAGTELMATFIQKMKGVAIAALFENGSFGFKIVENIMDVDLFKGSKYVKCSTAGIFSEIEKYIKNQKVLFIGLPCQVQAVKMYFKNTNNLYLVDLICHGSPSPKILEKFMHEKKISFDDIENILFRQKTTFGIAIQKKGSKKPEKLEKADIMDLYMQVFLECGCFTDNCYQCQYARYERISDISIGDAWGSILSNDEKKKGISLMLCNSTKGNELLQSSNMHLEPFDKEIAISCNKQLQYPSIKTKEAAIFLEKIKATGSFKKAFRAAYPIAYYKYKIKQIMR